MKPQAIATNLAVGGFSLLIALLFPFFPTLRHLGSLDVLNVCVLCISWPHLAGTWERLYRNAKTDRANRPESLVVGVVAPLGIFSTLLAACQFRNVPLLSGAAIALHAATLVHIGKQTYGLVIMSGRRANLQQADMQKRVLRYWALTTVMLAIVVQHANASAEVQFGVEFVAFRFLRNLLPGATIAFVMTSILLLTFLAMGKVRITVAGGVAMLALVVWVIPGIFPLPLFALVAVSHALQAHVAHQWHPHTPRGFARRIRLYALMGIGGFVVLWLIPHLLQQRSLPYKPLDGSNPWMTVIGLTIHLHHVYADRFAWRSNSRAVKPTKKPAPSFRSVRHDPAAVHALISL
jgi:hypothetical protein